MKKILILGIILIFANFSYASFEDLGRDARAKGMANAFYGEPAGVSSISYNPAGTAFSKKIEVMGTFGLPYAGFDALNFQTFNGAFIIPFTHHFKSELLFKNTVIGVAFNNFSLKYDNSEYDSNDDLSYYERKITLNLSKDLLNLLGRGTRFAFGFNFDLYLKGVGENIDTAGNSSYFAQGLDTSGFGIDLGFMYFLNMNMILGVVIDNLIEPNVAFNKDLSEDIVKRNTKLGLSWKSDKLWKFKYATIAGGVSFEDLKSDVWEYRLGFEFWEFKKVLGIRTGYEFSDEGMSNLSFGLTGKKVFKSRHEIRVNYSFALPLGTIRGSYGTHTFSLVYKYSMPAYKFEFDDRKRRDMIDKLEEAKQKQLENLKKEEELKKKEKQKTEKMGAKAEEEAKIMKIHTIVEGDNLYNISKMYYGSIKYWKNLAEYNNLLPPNYGFRIGQKLKIPPLEELNK